MSALVSVECGEIAKKKLGHSGIQSTLEPESQHQHVPPIFNGCQPKGLTETLQCVQEIELSTGDFKASSAFAEGLLACAAHTGNWLQSIRVVQALPSRQCNPKVVYGEKGTRLEMYRGAQVSYSPFLAVSQDECLCLGCLDLDSEGTLLSSLALVILLYMGIVARVAVWLKAIHM